MKKLEGTKTQANLMAAFAGESQAHTKYQYYASKAKKDGYNQIAAIFTETAMNEKEHAKIWFKLLEFDGERFKGQLIQEPYDVSHMHEGDEGWFTVEDVTDWIIYLEEFSVAPDTAYLLV